MEQPELLDAVVVRTWAHTAVDALATARSELDGVNVFPVADGDTGTNMYLTAREAAAAVHDADVDASGARLLRLAARASLLGARGNSGVILSEWLRGLAVAASRRDSLGIGLDVAARSARQAVAHPMPGTILTAADSAAAAARHAEAGGMVGPLGSPARLTVLDAARRGAREAALRSVGTLAPLREAGVLDAGACGLVLILASLAAAQGSATAAPDMSEASDTMSPVLLDMDLRGYTPATGSASVAADDAVSEPAPGTSDEIELMFVLHRSADAEGFRPGAVADALRTDLDDVGNSVVVVGGGSEDDPDGADSLWQAHVHAPDLAEALAVARRWARRGEISHVYVRHLAVPPADWAVVVTTSAPALAGELARGGAVVLLDLDTTPTVDDLAQTILGAGTPHVLVLADPALAGPALDDAVATLAARGAAGEQPDVVVVPAASDAHLACAVSALADASDASGPSGDADLPGVARAVLGSLRTARDSADRIGGLLEELMADCDGDPGIVAILPDTDVAPAVVDQLTACAERAADGADVVVLPTGRPGALVAVGVEPADPAHEPAPGAVTGAAW